MRIALAVMDMDLGGGGEHDVLNLSSGLRKAGHYPIVVTSGGRMCKEVEAEGVPVVLCPLLTRTPGNLWKNGQRLAAIAQEHQIEVLNPQGVYPGVSCYFASRRLLRQGIRVPNAITIPMLSRFTWWYYKLGSFVLNRVADHIIVESDCERLRLQNRGMNRPVSVIFNCFPPSKYSQVTQTREEVRREMDWSEDKVIFIMPARMSPEKRHDLLFEAIARPEVRELPVHFYLAGDGPLLETNKALAQQMGIAGKVTFGGFRRDMPKLYRGADVFLLCSRYESLPLSIREGMVASLPVLATNVGGISESVFDGYSGILVPGGDAMSLAGGIVKLAGDPQLRRDMGRRGNEIFQHKFDFDNWVNRTVEIMSGIRRKFIEEHP